MIFRARNLVFLFLVAAFVFADESSKSAEPEAKSEKKATDPQPIPTTIPSSSSTTVTPPTHPTTTENATTPATTTTTIKPTTPPPTPTPTLTPPPTPTPTTTSTEKPTPTTPTPTPKPTPTTPKPTPTPTPTPTIDNWTVKDANGTVCITANMVIRITVPYKSIENKTVEATFKVDSVQNATATGSCSGNTESLVLSWSNVTATFHFALNVTDHTYSLDSVNVAILVDNATFPNNTMANVTEVELVNKGSLFTVPHNNSYTCTTVPVLSLSGANNTVSGKLTVANVKVQAFGTEKSGKFRAPLDCASTDTPDIVPIAVGLILAGLVVVVLVAYLVGRRRAQARGYLSM